MLKPLDTLEILAIVDNEVDPISKSPACVSAVGGLGAVAMQKGKDVGDRRGGGVVKEVAMEQVCCGAHGLSLMIVSNIITFLVAFIVLYGEAETSVVH